MYISQFESLNVTSVGRKLHHRLALRLRTERGKSRPAPQAPRAPRGKDLRAQQFAAILLRTLLAILCGIWALDGSATSRQESIMTTANVLLGRLHYADEDERLMPADPQIVFAYDVSNPHNGQLAK